MSEIGEVERVRPVWMKSHDLTHGVHGVRLPVRGKAHDLVLVAIMGKAEILRQRLIKDAKRMRKIDAAIDADVFALASSPGGAGEIAKAVDGEDDGRIERRDVKRRREMCEVMLDLMHFAAKILSRKARRQQIVDASRARRFL